jgi:hypothetical protein
MDRAATELFGAASGALEAATAELKLLLVAGGFGQLFAKMNFPSGVTCSTPAVNGQRPNAALDIIIVAGSH